MNKATFVFIIQERCCFLFCILKLILIMDNVLFTFNPNTSEQSLYFIGGLILFIVCLLLFFFSLKNNKKLLLLFSGFIGIVALGTSIFSYLTENRILPVQLYENGISSTKGFINFNDIEMIKLDEFKEHSKYPIQKDGQLVVLDQTKLLIIKEYNSTTHVLSGLNYPVNDIYNELETLVQQWREKNKSEK